MRIVATFCLLVSTCAASEETSVVRGATMGTTYQIKFVATSGEVDTESLHAAVETVLADVDRQMSTYRPDSELSQFNRAAAGQWFPVSAATAEVAAAAQTISQQTDGAMDVTVGPLVRLWHFGPPKDDDGTSSSALVPPSNDEIEDARTRVGYQQFEVRVEPPALRKQLDGLEVDLSSIASGYAIDRLSELLRKHRIRNYMVELGGEVRAAGKRKDGKPWRVGVERPSNEYRQLQTAVPLDNAAIATAGDYRKYFDYEGRRYSHVIDPSTGRPIEHELASVTVVADTCMEADGWDTPLLVLGAERGYECAKEHDVAALFISHGDGAENVRPTPAWKKRFGTTE